MLVLAAAAFGGAVFNLYFVIQSESLRLTAWLPRWLIFTVGYSGSTFFGLYFIYFCYRLLKPKPLVTLSQEGISGSFAFFGAGFLRWKEIARIFPYDFIGRRFLGIIPKNNKAEFRQSIMNTLLIMSGGTLRAPVNIPEDILSVSIDELLKQIRQYHSYESKDNA